MSFVNLMLEAVAGMAAASGVWGLVLYRKNGNGNGHAPEPPVPAPAAPPVKVDVTWVAEKFTQNLEAAFAQWNNVLMAQNKRRDAEIEKLTLGRQEMDRLIKTLDEIPGHISRSFSDLALVMTEITDQYTKAPPPVWTLEITERLDELIKDIRKPVPMPKLPELAALTGEIRELVDVGRKQAARAAEPSTVIVRETAPAALASPIPASPQPKESRPTSRATGPIILDEFNPVPVDAFTVYELQGPEPGVFSANILNLGPGWFYIRANAEPTVADPKATTLPPGGIDNDVRIGQRLYVLASDDGTITVRLTH